MREWLKILREKQGLTQEQVSDSAGISRSYYTNIEKGAKTPSVTVAKALAGVLLFNWDIFFNDECSLKEHSEAKGA